MKNFDLYHPHEITPFTMAILTHYREDGKRITRVLEENTEYTTEHSPTKVIDGACRFFGASLKGRQDGTRDICGLTHKAPISVDPSSGMYFFPTTSPASQKCCWIAHSHIDRINRAPDHQAEIIFKNGSRVTIEASYGSIINQVQRTAQFRFLLDNRIKFLQQYPADSAQEPLA